MSPDAWAIVRDSLAVAVATGTYGVSFGAAPPPPIVAVLAAGVVCGAALVAALLRLA